MSDATAVLEVTDMQPEVAERVLSDEQQLVAEVSYVTEMLGMLDKTARAYIAEKHTASPLTRDTAAEDQMIDVLQRVYLADGDSETLAEIRHDVGEELTETCQRLIVQLNPAMGELRDHINQQATKWRGIRRFVRARRAANKANQLDPERRMQLYPDDPALDDDVELHPPIPAVLETGTEVYKEVISVLAGAALYELGAVQQLLGPVLDKHALAAVVGASVCYYISLLPVGIENYRLAKYTGSSLNPAATSIHKFLHNSKELVRSLSTVAASYSMEPFKELGWYAAAAVVPERGPGYLIGASIANIVLNVVQTGISEAYLHHHRTRDVSGQSEPS